MVNDKINIGWDGFCIWMSRKIDPNRHTYLIILFYFLLNIPSFFGSAVILDLPSSYKWMGYFCFSLNTNGLIIFLKLISEVVCTFLLVSIPVMVDTFNLTRETSLISFGRRSLDDFGPVTMCCRTDIVGKSNWINSFIYVILRRWNLN